MEYDDIVSTERETGFSANTGPYTFQRELPDPPDTEQKATQERDYEQLNRSDSKPAVQDGTAKKITCLTYINLVLVIVLFVIVVASVVFTVVFVVPMEQDGGWSSWQNWGSCSESCGGGIMSRSRTCSNPKLLWTEKQCTGSFEQVTLCNRQPCPGTDGGWSVWESWSTCSHSCGVGLRSRSRSCTNPSPSLTGRPCTGDFTDVSICNRTACPDCTCGGNQICIREDNEKKCIPGQHCTESTCQNGGTCVQTGSNQTCYCRAGFKGEDCSQSDGELSYHLHFTKAPQDRALKRNEGHIEECVVEAPEGENVQYDWTFNGMLIKAYNRTSGYGVHQGGVLQIDKFTEDLEGQYSCRATTSAETAEHTFEYRLVEDCDVSIFPGPESETKKIHENALFICRVDSRAKEVRWKKDGVYIDFDSNPRFRKIVSTYLAISDVRMEDAGTYQCEAEDTNGCFSYKEGSLTVINVKHISKYCGQLIHDTSVLASSRISKGYKARPNENPWHVTFRSIGDSSKQRAFCGGTLITQSYILTAASCIKEFEKTFHAPFAPNNVQFLLGTTNCLGDNGTEITRTFKSFTVHPEFGLRAPYDNDIALIELEGRVEYTDSISPICLEPDEYNDRVFLENSVSLSPVLGKVAGCGKLRKDGGAVRFLQEIHLPYVYNEDCLESFKSSSNLFTDRMFCAGSNIARTGDACQGDSGGGYVMATANRWVQTGIVSWGMGGCDVSRFYSIYTKVGSFYDWIDGITKFSEEEVPDFLNQF